MDVSGTPVGSLIQSPSVPNPELGWFLRVAEFPGYADKIFAFCSSADYTKVLVVKHTPDSGCNRPHWHFVLMGGPKLKAMRARIVKCFDAAKGNTNYELESIYAESGAGSYLFHTPCQTPTLVRGYSDDEVASFRAANESIQAAVKVSKAKAAYKLVDLCIQEMGPDTWTEREIHEWMIRATVRLDKYMPSDFQMKTFVSTIQLRAHARNGSLQRFIDMEYQRLFLPHS